VSTVKVEVRKALCKGCRMMKPVVQFKWMHESGVYCSQGCVAKVQWTFIPVPRQASDA
jgi:hypothetical protein